MPAQEPSDKPKKKARKLAHKKTAKKSIPGKRRRTAESDTESNKAEKLTKLIGRLSVFDQSIRPLDLGLDKSAYQENMDLILRYMHALKRRKNIKHIEQTLDLIGLTWPMLDLKFDLLAELVKRGKIIDWSALIQAIIDSILMALGHYLPPPIALKLHFIKEFFALVEGTAALLE